MGLKVRAKKHSNGGGKGRSGQAMIEFVVGIIAVLVVFAGAIQIILLSVADTDTMVAATAEACDHARKSALGSGDSTTWISDWDVGADGFRQTKDDVAKGGDSTFIQSAIAGRTAPGGDWSATDEAHSKDLRVLHDGALPMSAFGLLKGEAEEDVPILPAIQSLFGLAPVVTVRNEVWMTATGGL